MNVLIYDSNEQLNEAGATIITGLVQTNPRAVLGLATGSTPIGIYQEIVKAYQRGLVSFKEAKSFNLDEYVNLPSDHPESYHVYMKKNLFDHIDLPAASAHIPNGNASDVEAEGAAYDKRIEDAGRIDLQILGIGHNGHIGFNEPSDELIRGTHLVELAQKTREANARFFDSIDDVPKQALTMGVGTILQAKTVMLVVRGADKAEIVKRALTGPITTDCPASLLQTHPNLIVLLDQEAARLLA